uniref:Uncharacterized protein n=1 Tax=Romanomermis culicivorax TaxID=13658 RepID=A0A915JFB3_ROMCU
MENSHSKKIPTIYDLHLDPEFHVPPSRAKTQTSESTYAHTVRLNSKPIDTKPETRAKFIRIFVRPIRLILRNFGNLNKKLAIGTNLSDCIQFKHDCGDIFTQDLIGICPIFKIIQQPVLLINLEACFD